MDRVTMVGSTIRDRSELAGAALAQMDDPEAVEPSVGEVKRLLESEAAHNIFQAGSRTCCREVVGDKAKAADWYVIHVYGLEEYLKEAMPGARWTTWGPKRKQSLTAKIANTVVRVLAEAEGKQLSTRALKQSVEARLGMEATGSAWKRGRDRGIERDNVPRKQASAVLRRPKLLPDVVVSSQE